MGAKRDIYLMMHVMILATFCNSFNFVYIARYDFDAR